MRIPMIVPNYAALGEWPKGGVVYSGIHPIPFFNVKGLNSRAGIADMEDTIEALEYLYSNAQYRNAIAELGHKIATEDRFNWNTIAQQFDSVFKGV